MKDERNINMVPYEHRSIYGDDDVNDSENTQDVHQNYDNDYGANPLLVADDDNDNDTKLPPPSSSPPMQPLSIEPTTMIPKYTPWYNSIKHKLILLLPLLLSLYILTDDTYLPPTISNQRTTKKLHHLAFITALSRHPPSLRVFRIVSEVCFLLGCIGFALWVWECCDKRGVISDINRDGIDEDRNGYSDDDRKYTDNDNAEGSGFLSPNSKEIRRKAHTLLQHSNNNNTALCITQEIVGNLLFAPPPNSIKTNIAYDLVSRKHASFIRRRRRRRSKKKKRSQSEGSSNGDLEMNVRYRDDGDSGKIGETELNDVTAREDIFTTAADSEQEMNGRIEEEEELLRLDEPQEQQSLPPPSTKVFGATLDLTIVTCMFLILFTISSAEGGRYIDITKPTSLQQHEDEQYTQESWMKYIAQIASPIFPLTLFFLSTILLFIPWYKRKNIWTILSLTIGAPCYEVTFRDGFIGDILTSTVRPLQDLAYTIFFIPLGVKAWWSTSEMYTLDAAAIPLERSWLLHTVVLPACTLSPLWWRFLQNLRQCYDNKKRWPYLGNAFKYLVAAEVATFGMFDPSVKQNPIWLTCFFSATMYQIWWDVFMDWGLLERDVNFGYHGGNGWQWPYSLRAQRLYKRTWIYYVIFAINFCLRFVGMLTLIPPVYLSRSTGLIVRTYNDPDIQLFVGSLIASAEIFRRTIWALLRLEWEVIKTNTESKKIEISSSSIQTDDSHETSNGKLFDEEDMKPMAIASSNTSGRRLAWPSLRVRDTVSMTSLSDMSNLNDIQVLSELCVWATVFSGIAIIAAAHREVL